MRRFTGSENVLCKVKLSDPCLCSSPHTTQPGEGSGMPGSRVRQPEVMGEEVTSKEHRIGLVAVSVELSEEFVGRDGAEINDWRIG